MLKNQAMCMSKRILRPKLMNQAVIQLEMTDPIYCFSGFPKITIIAQFSVDILQIQYC